MCLAIPGKILSVEGDDPAFREGKVDFGGIRKQVSLACTPNASPGDYVLVHAGLALQILDEAAAHDVFAAVAELERGLAEPDATTAAAATATIGPGSDPEPTS